MRMASSGRFCAARPKEPPEEEVVAVVVGGLFGGMEERKARRSVRAETFWAGATLSSRS